jgi:hypothetical protein
MVQRTPTRIKVRRAFPRPDLCALNDLFGLAVTSSSTLILLHRRRASQREGRIGIPIPGVQSTALVNARNSHVTAGMFGVDHVWWP